MTIVTYKRPCYIDLLGDPIEKSTLSKIVDAPETSVNLLSSALTMSLDNTPNDLHIGLSTFLNNAKHIFMYRYVFEKMILNDFDDGLFISKEKLQDICIDTLPDAQASIQSVTKYGLSIRQARNWYGIISGADAMIAALILGTALTNPTEPDRVLQGTANFLGKNAAAYSRNIRGLYRFNKLAKGDWAIIDTPDKQEYLEKDLFRLPSLKDFTSPAPQGA